MEMIATLLVVTLVAQAILFCFTTISWLVPAHRVWPPPSRNSWQFYATWFLSWLSLSGVFLLALFSGNSLGLPVWLRVGLGFPLLGLGVLLIAWGFRALSIPTALPLCLSAGGQRCSLQRSVSPLGGVKNALL